MRKKSLNEGQTEDSFHMSFVDVSKICPRVCLFFVSVFDLRRRGGVTAQLLSKLDRNLFLDKGQADINSIKISSVVPSSIHNGLSSLSLFLSDLTIVQLSLFECLLGFAKSQNVPNGFSSLSLPYASRPNFFFGLFFLCKFLLSWARFSSRYADISSLSTSLPKPPDSIGTGHISLITKPPKDSLTEQKGLGLR